MDTKELRDKIEDIVTRSKAVIAKLRAQQSEGTQDLNQKHEEEMANKIQELTQVLNTLFYIIVSTTIR